MSNHAQPRQQEQELEHDEDDTHLSPDDVIEVHEDEEGDEPMDEDGDEYESDGDNAKYDGEIIIGAPGPGEEEAMMEEMGVREDNSWGVVGRSHSNPLPTLAHLNFLAERC